MEDACMPVNMSGDLKKKVGETVTKTIDTFSDGKGDILTFKKNTCGAAITSIETVNGPDGAMKKIVKLVASKAGSFNLSYKNTACDATTDSSCTITG